MSRLIVKGLPKHATEKTMREWFSSSVGEVTDARVMRTKDGRSRQFGFIGFATAEAAAEAQRKFHNTFMDTSRLVVTAAKPRGDKEIPRAWSKYTVGSRRYAGEDRENNDAQDPAKGAHPGQTRQREEDTAEEVDPAFEEFKLVAQPRRDKALWGNADTEKTQKQVQTKVKSKKTGGENTLLTRTHMTFGNSDDEQETPGEEQSDGEYEDIGEVKSTVENELDKVANKAVSDIEYFASKIRKDFSSESDGGSAMQEHSQASDDADDTDGGDNDEDEDDQPTDMDKDNEEQREHNKENAEESQQNEKDPRTRKNHDATESVDLSETGRLFLRNLAYTVAEQDIEELFEPFGAIAEVHLCLDPETKLSRGTAYVLYVVPENAIKAMDHLDGQIFQGRLLHIIPARAKPERDASETEVPKKGTSSYKRKQEDAKKESAKSKSDSSAWNALFMRTDAVAEVLADRSGVSKMDIYGADGGESGSAAVRLAKGEAKLQQEARKALRAEGINVDAFSGSRMRVKRSKTIILAKNLSKGTRFSELRDKFSAHGSLGRLVMVPSSLIAVVEFLEPGDARRAYNALAYTRLGNVPLYLEWAPVDAFLPGARTAADAAGEGGRGDGPVDAEHAAQESYSVFVKNLNFETKDAALHSFFRKVGGVRTARVARKRPAKQGDESLSAGYGFVEFETKELAKEGMKRLQGKVLDGHKLELKLSTRGHGSDARNQDIGEQAKRVGKSPKLLVKNVAFEATAKDIRGVFTGFGQLKSVRMPKKGTGQHRGYAFVEFMSKGDAAQALDMLRDTHLYGRHLVIDYAEEDPRSVEELIEREGRVGFKRRRMGTT